MFSFLSASLLAAVGTAMSAYRPTGSLTGTVAIVTGGSGSIGGAVGQSLCGAGATVVLTARSLASLEDESLRIREAVDGARVSCVVADVTDEDAVRLLFEAVVTEHGRVDVLINNAGVSKPGTTCELDAADLRESLEVNVVGCFLCAQAAFRVMSAQGGGRIVNVGSLSAMVPRPHSAAYSTSKFALQGLSRSLALDGRELGIAVGTIHPGNVASPLLSPEELERRQECEGVLEPSDVAAAVLTMCQLPPQVNILELTIMPTKQPFVGRG